MKHFSLKTPRRATFVKPHVRKGSLVSGHLRKK